MHPRDEHLLAVVAVKDADLSALGQAAGGEPQKIVVELLCAWALEVKHQAILRVHPGYDVFDGTVLSRCIHRLENHQQGVAVDRLEQVLLPAQIPIVLSELFFAVGLRFVERLYPGRPALKFDGGASLYAEGIGFCFHGAYGLKKCRAETIRPRVVHLEGKNQIMLRVAWRRENFGSLLSRVGLS